MIQHWGLSSKWIHALYGYLKPCQPLLLPKLSTSEQASPEFDVHLTAQLESLRLLNHQPHRTNFHIYLKIVHHTSSNFKLKSLVLMLSNLQSLCEHDTSQFMFCRKQTTSFCRSNRPCKMVHLHSPKLRAPAQLQACKSLLLVLVRTSLLTHLSRQGITCLELNRSK